MDKHMIENMKVFGINKEKNNETNVAIYMVLIPSEIIRKTVKDGRNDDFQELMKRDEMATNFCGMLFHPKLPYYGFIYDDSNAIHNAFRYYERFFGTAEIINRPLYIKKESYEYMITNTPQRKG